MEVTKIRELEILDAAACPTVSHISAASGLVVTSSSIYVVADDELHLGEFSLTRSGPGHLKRLFDGVLPAAKVERKRRKPDLEALTLLSPAEGLRHGALLALGSASRGTRCRGVLLELDDFGRIAGPPIEMDMSSIVEPLRGMFAEVNFEGAVVFENEFRLFQRGNKGNPYNAIIRYPLDRTLRSMLGEGDGALEPTSVMRVDLPFAADVPFCFTDAAILPGGEMVFSAVAEDTADAYNDGACVGAGVGILGDDGRLLRFEKLDAPYKVEGIVGRPSNDRLELLLVTDADDRSKPALLLSASF